MTAVAQRLEMVRRIAGEIEGYMVELGTDGRLLALQLDELIAGSDAERQLIVQGYPQAGTGGELGDRTTAVLAGLDRLSPEEMLDMATVATVLELGGPGMLDEPVEPRGYRCGQGPPAARPVAERLVGHFGGLQKLLAASVAELQDVDGVAGRAPGPPGRACPG